MLKFDLTKEVDVRVSKEFFNKKIKRFYKILKARIDKLLGKRNGTIDLVLINDETMKAMNKEFRGKTGTTDVMAFAYLEVTDYKESDGDIIVGDIFISVDRAKKQAEQNGHSLKKELDVLFVHGLLHCFGFDHQDDKQEKKMEKWARKIIG